MLCDFHSGENSRLVKKDVESNSSAFEISNSRAIESHVTLIANVGNRPEISHFPNISHLDEHPRYRG